MRRKNPLSGDASFGQLTVRELRLGEDDQSLHTVRGLMELDGDVDAFVLRVKENAQVERLLLVRRLEVGKQESGGYGSGSGGSGSGGGSGGYGSGFGSGGSGSGGGSGGSGSGASGYPGGSGSGATIDEDGVIRTERWIVAGSADKGLVLRSPDGRYYGFTVDDQGNIAQPGRYLGTRAP